MCHEWELFSWEGGAEKSAAVGVSLKLTWTHSATALAIIGRGATSQRRRSLFIEQERIHTEQRIYKEEELSKMATTDPRQPSSARPYVPPVIGAQDLPPDYASLLAIVFGIAGVMLRHKLGSWLALICCVQSLANMKSAENDLKQVVMAATFAVMGMVTNYMGPPGSRTPAK